MSFAVAAEAYDRFMGRYSEPLAPLLADFAGISSEQRVIDVGCGPGALTAELARRVGPRGVSAVDPSESFVAAMRERHPEVTVQHAPARRSCRSRRTPSTRLSRSWSSTSWPTRSRDCARWLG
jgi:trans-aconitate methyltransferase